MTNAKPLTRREWDNLRPVTRDGVLRASDLDDAALSDRIEATIENGGWAKEEPTTTELDQWAARHVKGWRLKEHYTQHTRLTFWTDGNGTKRYSPEGWSPTSDIAQALDVIAETDHDSEVSIGLVKRNVTGLTVLFDGTIVHKGAIDFPAAARALMVALYRELGQ